MGSSPGGTIAHFADLLIESRHSDLAAATLVLYDHLITFTDEISLIWSAPWSKAKILFILLRYHYIVLVVINTVAIFSREMSIETCKIWFRWQDFVSLITSVLTQLTLQMRVHAMYNDCRWMHALLIVAFFCSYSASLGALIAAIVLTDKVTDTPVGPAGPRFCAMQSPSVLGGSYYVPLLVLETLLVVLVGYKGYQAWRESDKSPNFIKGGGLLVILTRDSFLWFIAVFGVYLTNCLFWFLGDSNDTQKVNEFGVAVSTLLSTRLILNLRGYYENSTQSPTDIVLRDLEHGSGSECPSSKWPI